MAPSREALPAGDHDLLRILCCVAWSDGEISAEEKTLLSRLAERMLLPGVGPASAGAAVETLVSEAMAPEALDALIPRLGSDEERTLALKLAYMVIRIGQRPGDGSSINPQEKLAYRRLVEGLGLEEDQIEAAEWAAEQELAQHTSLLGVLASRFGGLGAWPSSDLLEVPGAPRL